MIAAVSRAFFTAAAGSRHLRALASRYGMRSRASVARRFIAGETVDEAIQAGRDVEAAGMLQTLDYLGASVASMAQADQATREYLRIMVRVSEAGIGRNVSLRLSQLGLGVDRATCVDNLRRILDVGTARQFFVRIDMESSAVTDVTLDVFQTMWQQGYRNVGVVLQSKLRRSAADAARMNTLGAHVRLVKGAYREPRAIAFQATAEVDTAFLAIMRILLAEGTRPAIATHDPLIIEATKTFAAAHGVARDAYEFQLLYGIRRDLQAALAAQGHAVRIGIPFGGEWFPYFMRRLAERPANAGFVLRSLRRER